MKDRGMKKWLAYKSLTSQADFLNAMHKEKAIEAKPMISESEAERINDALTNYSGEPIVLSVYLGGHVKTIEGIIRKIDPIYKMLEINDIKIPFKNIVGVE